MTLSTEVKIIFCLCVAFWLLVLGGVCLFVYELVKLWGKW